VAGEDALDQYFMRHPEDFFARGAEHAVLNPDNPVILARHLECAAAEIPLSAADPWLASPGATEALQRLEQEGLLLRSADGSMLLASRKRPQRHVDLRGSGSTYTIEDGEGHIIGSVDGHRALRETHPGAVYLHRGRTWVVQQLDPGARKVVASPARVGWYTRVRGNKQTEILDVQDRRVAWGTRVFFGRLRVTETVTGYEKRSASGGRLLGVTPLDLPPTVFETEGLWFEIPDAAREATERELLHFMGSIHALEHAAIGILPLLVMTDRNDLGGISTPMHPQVGRPAVFIYDGMPGGAGLSRLAFVRADELFARTRDAIADCPCETGCPSCVHSPKCGSGNRPIDKAGALFLLDSMAAGTPERDDGPSLHAVMPSDGVPLLPTEEHGVHDKQPEGTPPEAARDGSRPAGDRGCITPASYDAASISPSHPDDETLQENTMNATYTAVTPNGASAASSAMVPPEKASSVSSRTVAAERKSAPRVMVLDVETRRSAAEVGGWHRADRMGVSIAVLHDSADDSFTAYPQDEVPAMLHRLREADLVVGFNIARFDYTVLSPFAPFDLHTLPTLDMLQKVKDRLSYRVSLDNLAQATLNAPKSADGLQALRWWQEGRLDLITEYCRKDVELTRDLYLYGLANGYLLFTNKAGQTVRVPVEW
jgi:DEAD/DEAH box helicase domain-containing protein